VATFGEQLNEQIGHELAASHQYVAIALYYSAETLPQLADFFFRQAVEERNHAMMISQYMLDAEQDGITVQDCLDWLGVVEPVLGRPAAVYTGGYVAGGSIWKSPQIFNGQRARVFAAYCSEADAKRHAQGIAWDCWQWSSTGRVPGINANCDQDQVDNRAMFDKCCGLSGQVIGGGPKAIIKSGHARKMAGV